MDTGFGFVLKHYQLIDRGGDTFRWNGENCSANEIAQTIDGNSNVAIFNVFGIQRPSTDGRAGMAAVVLKEGHEFDVDDISALIKRDLATYAQPVFIRILKELPVTGTLKLLKGDLRQAVYLSRSVP
ncbi:MAG: acyl-CoA synthetase (AMP-forming)/AMP-acid ligase II [Candidatus Azotimanducaceae bacterium]|jgi:acyl-CoA synthetase (AMP-forming)/AMP-acid ligase II